MNIFFLLFCIKVIYFLILKGEEGNKNDNIGNMGTTEFVKQGVKGILGEKK